jgi:hypothetical protein
MRNEKIFNVNSFFLENDLIYLKEKYLHIKDKKILINQDGYKINKYKNNIFIEFFSADDGFERTQILSINKLDTEPVIIKLMQRKKILKNGITVFLDYDKEYNTYINVIDLNFQTVIWRIKDTFRDFQIVDDKYIVLIDKQYITVFNFFKNIEIWRFLITHFPNYLNDFYREQEADIKQIIGIYNQILWVHVGGFRLVGIDVKTGKQTHYIEDMAYHLGLTKEERRHFDFASYGNSIHLDENAGILKAFAHRYYVEIDLKNLQGKVKKDFGEDWRTSWRIKNSIYYQKYSDLLFFSGYYKNMDKQPNGFGVFDTGKSEILWYDTHKNDGGYFYTPPQANDKLLAILDDKHNLLVYNREDII